MTKISNKDKILAEGLKVVLKKGFEGASVRDIVEAAGVPQGSFSNHFGTKEAFGLEIIDIYFANTKIVLSETLRNESIAPLDRLLAYVDNSLKRHLTNEMKTGCLYGNFCAELSDKSELMREKILGILEEVQLSVINCLKAAVKSGDLRKDYDCEQVGRFFISSLQGATLIAKAERSSTPLLRFKHILQTIILK